MKNISVKKFGGRTGRRVCPNNLLIFPTGRKNQILTSEFKLKYCPVTPLAAGLLKNLKAAEDY